MISLWDNGASVKGRLSGSTETKMCTMQQTHLRLDVSVMEKEHRSQGAFVLFLFFSINTPLNKVNLLWRLQNLVVLHFSHQ